MLKHSVCLVYGEFFKRQEGQKELGARILTVKSFSTSSSIEDAIIRHAAMRSLLRYLLSVIVCAFLLVSLAPTAAHAYITNIELKDLDGNPLSGEVDASVLTEGFLVCTTKTVFGYNMLLTTKDTTSHTRVDIDILGMTEETRDNWTYDECLIRFVTPPIPGHTYSINFKYGPNAYTWGETTITFTAGGTQSEEDGAGDATAGPGSDPGGGGSETGTGSSPAGTEGTTGSQTDGTGTSDSDTEAPGSEQSSGAGGAAIGEGGTSNEPDIPEPGDGAGKENAENTDTATSTGTTEGELAPEPATSQNDPTEERAAVTQSQDVEPTAANTTSTAASEQNVTSETPSVSSVTVDGEEMIIREATDDEMEDTGGAPATNLSEQDSENNEADAEAAPADVNDGITFEDLAGMGKVFGVGGAPHNELLEEVETSNNAVSMKITGATWLWMLMCALFICAAPAGLFARAGRYKFTTSHTRKSRLAG